MPPTAASYEASERMKRLRDRRVRVARLWNDPSIAPSLLTLTVNYFAIGCISALAVVLAVLLRFPASPLIGAWPTFGWYFFLPNLALCFLVPLAARLWSERVIWIVFVFVASALVLDLYSLSTNVAWFYYYFANLLTPAMRDHQSLFQTAALLLIQLVLVFLHAISLSAAINIVMVLPDLKSFLGIGYIDDNGNYVEEDNDADDPDHYVASDSASAR